MGGGRRTKLASEEHPHFAEWYAAYPLHEGRADAVRAFDKAVTKVADVQVLFDAARRYRDEDHRVARGYIKAPSVWLNKECWNDEPRRPPAETGRSPSGGSGPSSLPPRDGYKNAAATFFGKKG